MSETVIVRYRAAMAALDGLRLEIPAGSDSPPERYLCAQLFTARTRLEWFAALWMDEWLQVNPVAAARAGVPEALAEFSLHPPETGGAGAPPATGDPYRLKGVGLAVVALQALLDAIPDKPRRESKRLLETAAISARLGLHDYLLQVQKTVAVATPGTAEKAGTSSAEIDRQFAENAGMMERCDAILLPALEDGEGVGPNA